MPITRINGINLYYESKGKGAPVVFIPGLGGGTELWAYQTEYFKKNYHTISLDNRGAGRSDKPFGLYTMHRFARDIEELLDHLDVSEPIILVGASMGGLIAQAFIHYYPQRVRKLVLACTGVSLADPHITLAPLRIQKKLASPGTTPDEKLDTFLEIFYHPDFVSAHPELRKTLIRMNPEIQPPHAYLAQLAACADPKPYYQWLEQINVPALVIHGSDDLVWPIQNAHTLMKGLGKNGRLAIIENTAHILMHEKPDEFNRVLEAFFKEEG
jgi:pimeloyl-ACP methyl ester carboxylesterase